MESAIYSGFISHERFVPKQHRFRYPFFMWYLDLNNIDDMQTLGRWFSVRRWALSRFRRTDYLGPENQPLSESVKEKMQELTGEPVSGKVFGLLNLRSLGLYFSPVNFYYGFADSGHPTHFLAEVSNIPWNERHHYAHLLSGPRSIVTSRKAFKVSPFNPVRSQRYVWQISAPAENISIDLGLHDDRGHVFQAGLHLRRLPFSKRSAGKLLLKKPVMTAFIVTGIYWQALRLFLKGVPYVPYEKEGV